MTLRIIYCEEMLLTAHSVLLQEVVNPPYYLQLSAATHRIIHSRESPAFQASSIN